jgi:hypothetical protein
MATIEQNSDSDSVHDFAWGETARGAGCSSPMSEWWLYGGLDRLAPAAPMKLSETLSSLGFG